MYLSIVLYVLSMPWCGVVWYVCMYVCMFMFILYIYIILWWYCSWIATGLVYCQPIVENSLKISLKISWQFLWQSILPHLLLQKSSWKNRWNFVKDFVASTQVWRNFNEVLDEISTFFCGKTFCHNILPQKKSFKFRQRFRCFNSSSDKILTKKYCGKTFCHKAPDEKSDEILTKLKRKKQQRKSLYQKILQVVGNHGGVRSQYIYMLCIARVVVLYIYL